MWSVFFILILTLFAFMVATSVVDHHSSVQHNEPTAAEIIETDIEMQVDDDDREYRPVVVYRYAVDGEIYQTDNVYPGQFVRWHDSRSTAQSAIEPYQVGQRTKTTGEEVTVHYNPAAPNEAYLRNDGWPSGWYIPVIYIPIGAAFSVHFIRKGFKRWRQRNVMANTPTETARSLSVGPSELKGQAVTGDRNPIKAPFSTEPCVAAKYEVKEYYDGDNSSGWRTKAAGVMHTPFYVDDGTGRVLIEPHDEATFDLDPDDWSTTYVDSSDRGPEPIQEFVETSSTIGYPSNASGKENDRRYKQNLIRPAESVYIYGTVQPRETVPADADNADRLLVKHVDDGSMRQPLFMISDDTEQNLITRRKWALWRLPFGGILMVVSFAFVLFVFGPLFGLEMPRVFDGIISSVS